MEFCECGSLLVRGVCTNKKCSRHVKMAIETATFKQVEFIRDLAEKLGEDADDIDFEYLSKKEAAKLINGYRERLELEE